MFWGRVCEDKSAHARGLPEYHLLSVSSGRATFITYSAAQDQLQTKLDANQEVVDINNVVAL